MAVSHSTGRQVPEPEVRVPAAVLQVVVRPALLRDPPAVRRPGQPAPATHHRSVRDARGLLLLRRELPLSLNVTVTVKELNE